MRLRRAWTSRASLSAACVAAALSALAAALVRAVTLEPVPEASRLPAAPLAGVDVHRRDSLPVQVIARAVARDPFRADRRAPATRFRMPGEPAPGRLEQPLAGSGELKLIGTAVLENGGGFAMCQAGAATPRVVRVGESLAGYTLSSVDRGRAVFRDGGGKLLELRVPKGGGS
jgi:hypothetical protein